MSSQKYFFMSENITRNPAGIILANEKEITPPDRPSFGLRYVTKRGIPPVKQLPMLQYSKKEGPLPRDIERFGSFWIISKKLKEIFTEFEADAFDFLECISNFDGVTKSGDYWFCDVKNTVDAVDEEKSDIKIEIVGGEKYYNLLGAKNIVISDQKLRGSRVFMLRYRCPKVVCNAELKELCKKEKIKNIQFKSLIA